MSDVSRAGFPVAIRSWRCNGGHEGNASLVSGPAIVTTQDGPLGFGNGLQARTAGWDHVLCRVGINRRGCSTASNTDGWSSSMRCDTPNRLKSRTSSQCSSLMCSFSKTTGYGSADNFRRRFRHPRQSSSACTHLGCSRSTPHP